MILFLDSWDLSLRHVFLGWGMQTPVRKYSAWMIDKSSAPRQRRFNGIYPDAQMTPPWIVLWFVVCTGCSDFLFPIVCIGGIIRGVCCQMLGCGERYPCILGGFLSST